MHKFRGVGTALFLKIILQHVAYSGLITERHLNFSSETKGR